MSVGHRQFVLLSENYRNLQKKANRFPPFRSNLGTEVSPGIPLAPAVLLEGVTIRGDAQPGTLSEKGPGQQPRRRGPRRKSGMLDSASPAGGRIRGLSWTLLDPLLLRYPLLCGYPLFLRARGSALI